MIISRLAASEQERAISPARYSHCVLKHHLIMFCKWFGNSILVTRALLCNWEKSSSIQFFFPERSKTHKSICKKEMSFSSVAAFVQNVSNCSPAHWLFPPRTHYYANAISCQLLFAIELPQFPISLSFSLVAHGGRD